MGEDIMDILSFTPGSVPFRGSAVVFDLADFARFFNEAGAQEYVPTYLNHVLDAFHVCLRGGKTYWGLSKPLDALSEAPIHVKFLGDGALYIWRLPDDAEDARRLKVFLCNRLFNLRLGFGAITRKISEDVPVLALPSAIRFGIAGGTIYELTKTNGEKEFIGFPINLASRLQSYCPDLGFIASAHILLTNELLDKYDYKRVVATSVRGFGDQLVIVDKVSYDNLGESVRKKLFREHEVPE